MKKAFKEIVSMVHDLNKQAFPFVPDVSQVEMFGALESQTLKAEGVLRLRGNIAERLLCSKYGLKFEDETNKKNITELLKLINVTNCSSNLTPDAYAITEDGKLMIYEFGISKNRREQKEHNDRQKWKKICCNFPVLVHVETMNSFDEVENPHVRSTLQKLEKKMIDFFKKMDKNEELREINLKYFWEIRDLFQQYPYLNKFKEAGKNNKEKEETLAVFPDLDRKYLPMTNKGNFSNQIKNVAKKRIKDGESFFVKTDDKSLNNLWLEFKINSLKYYRSIKPTKQGFKKTNQAIMEYFLQNQNIISLLNKLNKERKLKKLDYSYIFKLLGLEEELVPGPHDSLRWLDAIAKDCELGLKHGGKNAKNEEIYLKNCLDQYRTIFESYKPMNKTMVNKLKLLEQKLLKAKKTRIQHDIDKSHNENYILKCAKKRITNWRELNLQTIEDTSMCILRSANTSYTYKNSFLCYQMFGSQVVFYKTRGQKAKQFGIITDEGIDTFTAHPSRYICPSNIQLCIKNVELEYQKYSNEPMNEELRSCILEILLNQNKTTQRNIQNIRYMMMALNSTYHSRQLGKKISVQLKNDKNAVDYWLFKNLYESFKRNKSIFPFRKEDDQQTETRKMLFMSYLCNLITKDSQEKDIERVKANQKYFELKQDWQSERGWRLNNMLSIEEIAYGDNKGPTVSPAALNLFYDWFKLECLDYLDKFSYTKLKEPLAFDISNSNSCMTQVKSEKHYNKLSITNQLQKHHDRKMISINKTNNTTTTKDSKNPDTTNKVKILNEELQEYIDFYKNSGNSWIIEQLKSTEPYQLCSNLPYIENLKELAMKTLESDEEDDLTSIIKQRLVTTENPDSLHMCILLKIKNIKNDLRVTLKQTQGLKQSKFQNKLSSRNSTAIELLNEIRKEKIKNKEIISELTCIDLLSEIPNMNFALSYKEQVGGTRELYIGDIKTKIATKIVEEFAKQIKDINPISCLYDHSSETLIRKHVRNCQLAKNALIDIKFEDFLDLNDEQLSSVMTQSEEYLFGSLDHSKWGPLSMPSLFADMMDIFNEAIDIVGTQKNDLTLISDILWKHVLKKVEISSEYAEYLIKNDNTELKTSIEHVEKNFLDNTTDDYAKKLLNEGKLGMQTYPYDMGQGILHGWSDIWAGKTEEFIWELIKNNISDFTDIYNCVTSDDQASVLIGPENAELVIELHYILSKCLNKKISEKSVWGTNVFEFKSVFVSGGQELPPTMKFLIIPSFGFEVFDPLNYLNTTDTILQEAYDNCATIEQCSNLLNMSKRLLSCAGFGSQYLNDLSQKHFYSKELHAIMFDNMTFTERKLISLKESSSFKTRENQKLAAKIDEELSDWMTRPHQCVENAKKIARNCDITSWDPLMYGPIRVCSGRMKNNKENNIILSLDPSRNIEDPISAKLFNFIRKHFHSTTFSSLEQSIIESIKDSLRQMSSGESFSGLVATVRSNSFKLKEKYGNISTSQKENRQTILEDYVQLKIQLLIEKFSLDEKHFYSTIGIEEKSMISTEIRGTKVNDDFLVPALASLEIRSPVFFKEIVEPSIPMKKMKLMNSQQLIRMKLIEAADASFNMEMREPYEVFRLVSLNNNSTYYQGNDGICWEETDHVGTSKRNYNLKQVETIILLKSFIKPIPLNYETILEAWETITKSEFPNNVPVDGSVIQILIANSINEKRQVQICELLKSFPQHLSEKRTYQDQFTIIVSREILWDQQSVTICFSRNKLDKTNTFTIYWDKLPKFPEKKVTYELLKKLLSDDEIEEWQLREMRIRNKNKLNPNLFDKLSSPIFVKEGSLGHYKYVEGIPTFQEVHSPRLDHHSLTSQLIKLDICDYLKSILDSYAEMGDTVYEGMVDTKPDYLTTHMGNIITFKSSIYSSIENLSDKQKLSASKLFNQCFNEAIVLEVAQGFVLSKPEVDGWIFCKNSGFKKSESSIVWKIEDIKVSEPEESWLD
ncbi:RNA-dependent RNA polymerase [Universidad Nacional virus 1]|uniref:RNA-directed RNA polymerase L n=1 Tax=Universidad Nacional virus 1 TaxID=2970745 RepID=A0AAX3C0R2_9VIRU|nr:RNA-dependent RNA polymerase [Universidad Nacional virus 1]UUM00585.1 RNA-dependent RNA polymerase [Universidad Nacional virus 1]